MVRTQLVKRVWSGFIVSTTVILTLNICIVVDERNFFEDMELEALLNEDSCQSQK